ncbi:hypothetical protein MMC19_000434 [Ptychographa xylographoides]|nr:hypothetical protein [Ptychographa xylographoides]
MLSSTVLQPKVLILVITLICVLITLYSTSFHRAGKHIPRFSDWKGGAIPAQDTVHGEGENTISTSSKDWLAAHNISFPIRYGARHIVTQKVPGLQRESLTKIDRPLFDDLQLIESVEAFREVSSAPLVLEVPSFKKGPVKASQLIFGIQTTIKRLDDSIPQLARWLANTGAKLYVVLLEKEGVMVNTDQMVGLETRMRNQGFDVTLLPAHEEDTFPQRYFSLVNIMYQHRVPQTQWVSLIDDDTFFPSMSALLAMLAKYDAGEQYYVGSLSEDWWAVSRYGFMGFGGAGVFLSLPLAEVVDAKSDICKQGLRSSAGDVTLMDCIYAHTSTKLTPVQDLHQADMHGDISGFYESGRQHLSLHHWKEGSVFGDGLPMAAMHLVTNVCGECFLQRWQFGDDMVLTNGYSIATYPKGHVKSGDVNEVDMSKPEHTWNANMDVRHSLGPTRPKMVLEDEKIQYIFLDGAILNDGIRQLYFHKGTDGSSDSALELFWKDEVE